EVGPGMERHWADPDHVAARKKLFAFFKGKRSVLEGHAGTRPRRARTGYRLEGDHAGLERLSAASHGPCHGNSTAPAAGHGQRQHPQAHEPNNCHGAPPMGSPSAIVPSARWMLMSVEFCMKWTLPSANSMLHPPG